MSLEKFLGTVIGPSFASYFSYVSQKRTFLLMQDNKVIKNRAKIVQF